MQFEIIKQQTLYQGFFRLVQVIPFKQALQWLALEKLGV